ncbi:MAG: DUF262 domain-containing protein [Mesorhizobium sp.]|nr:MAG: DUF262 domain-containing protein [Mesorhizobium sp.]
MRLDQASVELSDLVTKIRSGRLDIQPDFQRGQVWNDAKKKRLIDTILRDWYVPAIHIVVNDELLSDEILDGQQRVRSILEFCSDEFTVDGSLDPYDETISGLGGLFYSQMPPRIRSKFDRYPLNTIRLRDYSPDEPGELFFRLNQNTSLTAAEQRNALIGEPRNQVRRLANELEDALSGRRIGFSNARMNYDDVIARLALTYENQGLGQKITASNLEHRYRSDQPFPLDIYYSIEDAILRLSSVVKMSDLHFRLNKASLFSWLLFVKSPYIDIFKSGYIAQSYFNRFEFERYTNVDYSDDLLAKNITIKRPLRTGIDRNPTWTSCMQIFNDRASSRVNDVSSIILRDVALHLACYEFLDEINEGIFVDRDVSLKFSAMIRHFSDLSDNISERASFEYFLADEWGRFRALR